MMAQNKTNKFNSGKNGSKPKGKGGSKGKGYKPRFSPKDQERENTGKAGDINDSSYYYGDNTVLDQVMNFSFNEFGGVTTEFPLTLSYFSDAVRSYNNKMVAAYYLNPSVPVTVPTNNATTDGISTAGLRNFLMLSGSNAKTTNYAPQDVTILILALAEIIKMSTFCARALGVAYLFNYRNRTYPETLLQAMGIDVEEFNNNLAVHRVRFNKLMAVASKIPFPADIPLFAKASTLYSSIYMDDPSSALAQTYLFVPYSTWVFNEEYDENGAGLETVTILPANAKSTYFSSILAILERQINALLTSTSLNYIYSDVMRLAQNGKLSSMITFSSIAEDFTVVPVYNEEIKIWIHNAMVMGAPMDDPSSVDPNKTRANDVCCLAAVNRVKYSPLWQRTAMFGDSALLDFDHDNVSVEEKVMATRLSARWVTEEISNSFYAVQAALCDEYVVRVNFYSGADPSDHDFGLNRSYMEEGTTQPVSIRLCDALSKFDWAPFVYFLEANNTVYPIGDLDYYTVVDYSLLKRIYDYEIIHLLQIG